MPINGDVEVDLHASQQKVDKWLRETVPLCLQDYFSPDAQSEDDSRNASRPPAHDHIQQRASHRHDQHHSPDLHGKPRRASRRSRKEAELSGNSSDFARRPRREPRPVDGFEHTHHDEDHRKEQESTRKPERHHPSNKKRRYKEPSCSASDSGSNRKASAKKTPRFEKAARHKTREDRYDTHRKADERRSHSAKEKENGPSRERRSPKRMSRIELPVDVMAKFRSDAILSENITTKRPGPGMFGTYTSSRRPIADLDYHEMNFLKKIPEQPQPKPLSASRARDRRREDIISEEVSAFFRHAPSAKNKHTAEKKKTPPSDHRSKTNSSSRSGTISFHEHRHNDVVRTTGQTARQTTSSSSRELQSSRRREAPQRPEFWRPESGNSRPKSQTPSSFPVQHFGQSLTEANGLGILGSRTVSGPDGNQNCQDAITGMTHRDFPAVADGAEGSAANPPPSSQAVKSRDQAVMPDQSSELKNPPPPQSNIPIEATGNSLDERIPLQGACQETARPRTPIEQRDEDPPARPISPKCGWVEKLLEQADKFDFSVPTSTEEYREYDADFHGAGSCRDPPPMTQVSEERRFQSRVHEYESHHLATEPETLRPRPIKIPIPPKAPHQSFLGVSTGFHRSRASELDEHGSNTRPLPSLQGIRVADVAERQHLDEPSLPWNFQATAPSTAPRVYKYESMARFISNLEDEVFSREMPASEYDPEPAYDDGVEADTYDPLEIEGTEHQEPQSLDAVSPRERSAPQFAGTTISMRDFWSTNPFTK